jgi:hypothetical protein
MLSLEQIRRLENRVYKAVELLKAMKEDNNILKSELTSANERVEELEQIISDYRNNQLEIEQGIVKAIQQLDDIDSIDDDSSSKNSEEPVLSAAISTETDPVQENFPIEIEEESSIPVTTDIISNSNTEETTETVAEAESESIHDENSQQLDIF